MTRGSARSKGHVIVAGLGNIGFRLVQSLRRHGEAVVAIERTKMPDRLQKTVAAKTSATPFR